MDSVSVIIINWNSESVLSRCLAALKAQTYPITQTIVVDNASRDEARASTIVADAPGVRVIKLKKNLGFAGGNNVGIGESTQSKWIALVNPDAFPEPDWLEKLMIAARTLPQYSFFGLEC
jgi:GT2 family glycosyltransferase